MEYSYKALKKNGKRIDEHRLVWIEHYGEIPEGYVIHHKDGDKRNNDISNLELMTLADHARLHFNIDNFHNKEAREKQKQSLLKYYETKRQQEKLECPDGYSKCSKCKQVLPIQLFDKHKKGKNGVYSQCKECRKKFRKDWQSKK